MTAALTCPSGLTCGSSSPPITNTIFSYDTESRVAEDYQCTPSTCPGNSYFSFPYSYDYIGDVLTATDGKGINYTNQYNAIGQLSQISTSWLSPTQSGTIASGIQYNPLGEPTSDQLGNLIGESWTYGADGNVASYSAGSAYSFSIPSIVGGTFVYSANDVLNGNWSYGYDNFGRLTSSSCSGSCPFSQSATAYTYNYDAEGNRWQQNLTQGTGDNSLHTFGAWNHISDGSVIYDSAGEITNDSSHTYSYDAEGHLLKVDAGNTATYVYDAFGHRISQQNSSGTFEYLFDLQNHPITKLQSGNRVAGEVWFGRHWASNTGSTIIFMHSDWLGTGRVWTDLNGNSTQYCQGLPFGDGLYCWSTNYSDNFAGLTFNFDDFIYDSQTRQLNPYNGRWTVPDPAGLAAVDPTNPQTWNRYSYVTNNPVSYIDPTGLVRTPDVFDYAGMSGGSYDSWANAFIAMMLSSGAATQCLYNYCGAIPIAGTGGFGLPSYGADGSISWSFSFPMTYAGIDYTTAALTEALGLPTGEGDDGGGGGGGGAGGETDNTSCASRLAAGVQKNTGVTPTNLQYIGTVGGHGNYSFDVSDPAGFQNILNQNPPWPLGPIDTGYRYGVFLSTHIHNTLAGGFSGHTDLFSGHILFPLHILVDVGIGHIPGVNLDFGCKVHG